MDKVKIKQKALNEEIELDNADYALYQTLQELIVAIKTLTSSIRSRR